MNTINPLIIKDKSIDEWMEQIKLTYSHMLKEHLHVYKKYDQLQSYVRDDKTRKYFDSNGTDYYDENGKINWEIIRQFIPTGMEIFIQEEYNMLNVNEVRLYCLLFFKVSGKTIAKILPYKEQSLRSIIFKSKQKAGMKDIHELYRKIIVNISSTSRNV